MTVADEQTSTHLRHPFHADSDGVNRPPGPDKHPYYGHFAASGPGVVPIVRQVNGVPVPALLICRHADVKEVLRRQDVFSRVAARDADPIDLTGIMLGMDGAQHARVRGTVKDLFTKPAVADLAPRVEAEAAAQLTAMVAGSGPAAVARGGEAREAGGGAAGEAGGGPADLLADFAIPYTLHVICDLLGLPAGDRAQFRRWGDAYLADSELTRDEAAHAAQEMGAYLWAQLERRRGCPAGDLLTQIATAAADETVDIQVKLPISLVVGGWETTANSIATFVHVLHSRPYQGYATGWEYLVDHPEKLDGAVSELERLHSTANADNMPRRVLADVELPSGTRLRAGDVVIASHDAANRDPRVFPDPERMDFDRDPNPHLSFGYGPHYCLGAHLGALEVRVALRLLLRELPALRLAVPADEVRWKAGHSILGPEELPVRW